MPSNLTYGVKLGREQLNATCNAEGTLVYEPVEGTILDAGEKQELKVTFVPFDTININKISKSVYVDVQKAVLTVKANDKIVNCGDTLPVLSFSYSGFINDENAGVLDVLPTITSIDGVVEAGTYPIVVSGGADNNYSFIYKSGNLIVNSGVGVDAMKSISMSVYPNPFTDKVTISSEFNGDGSYQLTDLTGNVISNGKVEDGNTNIMLSHIRKGVYLLQVKLGEGSKTFRLVKQ